ncbi:MAG: hypothetical protein IKL08_07470 [Clostridia bacterium]|nr:hypothetical protein [Clostridia bacterium]
MKSEKELFNLAKSYVMLESELDKPFREYEIEEIRDSMEEIRSVLLKKSYDVNQFNHYRELYKTMSIGEYFDFIKTL